MHTCITAVKPAHAVTSIKQSPVFKGHLFLSYPVIENFIWIEPLLRGHLSYNATFSLSQRWPLNTGLTLLLIFIKAVSIPLICSCQSTDMYLFYLLGFLPV
jgi:hypothetical protein